MATKIVGAVAPESTAQPAAILAELSTSSMQFAQDIRAMCACIQVVLRGSESKAEATALSLAGWVDIEAERWAEEVAYAAERAERAAA